MAAPISKSCCIVVSLTVFLALVSTHLAAASLSVYGTGGSSTARLMTAISHKLRSTYGVNIAYRAVGASDARQEFINGKSSYCSTSAPLTALEEVAMKNEVKLTLPYVLQTVTVFTYIPNVPHVLLTASVLARIFQGTITTWSHPDIMALNPSLAVSKDQGIFVVCRKDSGGSTEIFTRWLQVSAGNVWKLGSGPMIQWPATFIRATGSEAVAAAMQSTPFSIAYISTNVGNFLGVNEALIQNLAGKFLRSSNSDVYGCIPTLLPPRTASWSGVTLFNGHGELSWPMTTFVYFLARENAVPLGQNGPLLVSFLRYLMTNEGQNLAQLYDFYRLPATLLAANMAAISGIKTASGLTAPF
eukprot:TRINITY_DN256_c0_g1_i3.p1 TRINITY_DN256_c0_g1~~TRINITY_DN256_c0_g1_i3.p1  ORF type:complete len:358 (-),score=44.52 TRINITY_DN256_c0_g1_i3:360-1433(-)